MLHSPNFTSSKFPSIPHILKLTVPPHEMEGNIYELQTIVTVHIKQGIISNCIILKGIITVNGMQFANSLIFPALHFYHIWYIMNHDRGS